MKRIIIYSLIAIGICFMARLVLNLNDHIESGREYRLASDLADYCIAKNHFPSNWIAFVNWKSKTENRISKEHQISELNADYQIDYSGNVEDMPTNVIAVQFRNETKKKYEPEFNRILVGKIRGSMLCEKQADDCVKPKNK